MQLPNPTERYDRGNEAAARQEIVRQDLQNVKRAFIPVTGDRSDGTALVSLLAALAELGIIDDQTVA